MNASTRAVIEKERIRACQERDRLAVQVAEGQRLLFEAQKSQEAAAQLAADLGEALKEKEEPEALVASVRPGYVTGATTQADDIYSAVNLQAAVDSAMDGATPAHTAIVSTRAEG